jgi:hypothetical protein
MKTIWMTIAAMVLLGGAAWAEGTSHRIGVGATYWTALDDLDADIDEDGLSYLVSYQYRRTLVGFQVDAELLPDRFGEDAFAPAAYVVLGRAIYGAAGVGIVNVDGDWADDPFFALKVGLDLEVIPHFYLDISASYRFDAETPLDDALDDVDTDTVYLGAAVRFGF